MRLLRVQFKDARHNLAFEEAMCLASGGPTLRLWRNPPTAVIGYAQFARAEVNLETCMQYGVQVVRRHTGGGAVYHDYGNLNYSVVVPRSSGIVKGKLSSVYRRLLAPVLLALEELGVAADIRDTNSVFVGGTKVGGSSAHLGETAFFFHGTLLLNADLTMLWRVLTPLKEYECPAGSVASRRVPVTNLSEVIGCPLNVPRLEALVVRGFEKVLCSHAIPTEPSREEMELEMNLFDTKYSRDWWNLEGRMGRDVRGQM
ncbi:MAG TPA: lipoate--protein ligase family protein [Clostridia bacterium]|nr:lipoate--protein ligase family protein [Clostridia bacterium]